MHSWSCTMRRCKKRIDAISQHVNEYDDEPTISKTTIMWAAIKGAHKIPKKKKQGTKGNTSGIFHRRLYAEVAAAPA